MSKAIAFVVLLFISPAAYAATSHAVGGRGNWDTSVNYGTWASGQTFVAGDSLVFTFDPSHAVDEVNEADYRACNTGNAVSSDSNSPTTIPLAAAGTRYFICPRSNHCSQGMKLAVTVTAAAGTPSGGTPPAGGDTPSQTPGTPATRSSPPPPEGGSAAAALGGKTSFVGGLLLVLSAVFMG